MENSQASIQFLKFFVKESYISFNEIGEYKIKIDFDQDKIDSIDFVQNRLILFPAKWEHRGLDPIELATPRITLAFKTQMV